MKTETPKQTKFESDAPHLIQHGGHLPENTWLKGRPVLTEEEYILARIEDCKNNNHLSDMKTVQELLKGLVVSDGKSGWQWLKKWYEKQMAEIEKLYGEATDILAKSIDKINQRLKDFDNG